MDVTLFIGYQMHVQNRSQNTVWADLQELGVTVDLSTVFRQYQKYLVFMKGLSEKECGQLKETFQKNGGYVLSVDAVRSNNSPPLLVCRELTIGRTLKTKLLRSENEDEITEALRDVKKKFGDPIAVVSDLRSGILKAVKKVFPHAKHQYCHYHFLRNVGKDLMKEDYDSVRENAKRNKKKFPRK